MDPQPTTPGRGTILVVGAGATGGFFGALLAKRGQDVTFLVRPPRAATLRQHGLRVTGQGHDDLIDAKVVTSRDLADPFDLVLLSVKATVVAIVGHGRKHDATLVAYQQAARKNAAQDKFGKAHVEVVSFDFVTDPEEIALDLVTLVS